MLGIRDWPSSPLLWLVRVCGSWSQRTGLEGDASPCAPAGRQGLPRPFALFWDWRHVNKTQGRLSLVVG